MSMLVQCLCTILLSLTSAARETGQQTDSRLDPDCQLSQTDTTMTLSQQGVVTGTQEGKL